MDKNDKIFILKVAEFTLHWLVYLVGSHDNIMYYRNTAAEEIKKEITTWMRNL
jgi:hypothetical protein